MTVFKESLILFKLTCSLRVLPFFPVLFLCIGCANTHPQVELLTEEGRIVFEIYERAAPVTSSNFLRYVDEGRFDGATFYRVVTMKNQPNNKVKIEVIQGGLSFSGEHPNNLPPIRHETTDETGILHLDGTLSMARVGPGTAAGEIFICVGDQPELDFGGKRNPDGQGFAAFGKVIEGKDVVKAIQQAGDTEQMLDEPIVWKSVRRLP